MSLNPRLARYSDCGGFTLIELVATITVVSVLAAFAVPRFVGTTAFQSRGTYNQAQSIIRYAQKLAIAQRQSSPKTPIYVVMSSTSLKACYDAACTSPVSDPTTGSAMSLSAPTSVSFSTSPSTTSFYYDGSGAPSLSSQLTVTVSSAGSGDVNRSFYVEATTGYVHQ
jgi:MSHA pilin protein MshC